MATLADALAQATERLRAAGIDDPRAEARRLATLALELSNEAVLASADWSLAAEEERRLETLVERRAAHEPFAYIAGEREFWSLPFQVTPATLIPRPDTETVVDAALAFIRRQELSAPRILDLGTGSGCILLALLSELPEATGLGIDASAEALAVSERNARALGLAARATFRLGNWTEGVPGRFDLIVSNPPYIPDAEIDSLQAEVARFEPRAALAGGADGLAAYRAIAAGTAPLLGEGGALVLEIGAGQKVVVSAIIGGAGLDVAAVHADLSGIPRCIVATRREN